MSDDSPRPVRRERETGTALLLALFFLMVAAGIVASGTVWMRSTQTEIETSFRSDAQAVQFARSGLTEAMAWFRRQTAQPVLDFAPGLDPTATPPVLDTDDPDLGLSRTFRIEGDVFGRYVVFREWAGDPDPQRAQLRADLAARDVSRERGFRSAGTAWRLTAMASIFRQRDPALAFDRAPNQVLANAILETEIVRLRLAPPADAAVCLHEGSNCVIASSGRVAGGHAAAGVFFEHGSGTPTVLGSVTGSPGLSPSTEPFDSSLEAVFGASRQEIESAADVRIDDPADFPSPVPANALVFADVGPIVFDATRPLRGTGVVHVTGNVTFDTGSASRFSGLLHVDGDVILRPPVEISGSIVVTRGHRFVIEYGSDFIDVNFDGAVLESLRRDIGRYRRSGPYRWLNGAER